MKRLIRKDKRGLYNDMVICESESDDIYKLCNAINNEARIYGSSFIYSVE